jgi:hypothetical protein
MTDLFKDNDLLLYIAIIVVFLAFFIWNNLRLKRNRENRKNRNFRKRYMERKDDRRET